MSGHCPKCGDYTEEDESRLCSGCAKPPPPATPAEMPTCPNCKHDTVYRCVVCNDDGITRELASLRAKLAEAEKKAEDFKRIGQGFERDMRKHFEQSCTNLQRAEKAEAELAEWEAAGRTLAAEWNAINHLASCGDHSNGVEGDSGTDEGDYRACCEMERSAKAISANPLASRLVAEAGGTQ